MITLINQDITTVERGIIAHGVNAQGAMGSGVAGAIRKKWPIVYKEFKKMPTGKQMMGKMHLISVNDDDTLFVANCYTQEFYGHSGKFADPLAIQESLYLVFESADFRGLPVYLPKIGAGLGGLSWEIEVVPVILSVTDVWSNVDTFVCVL